MLDPADVIVLNSDIIVGPGWDSRLIEAARSRTDIATATALGSDATIFTVVGPDEWSERPPSVDEFSAIANVVSEASKRIYPIVPVATSFCTFFARHALNVVGILDEEFSPGYGEEVDFSLRCVAFGFTHIAVDDVYVFHATGESFGTVATNERKIDNDIFVTRRYPFWHEWVSDFVSDSDTPLARVRDYTSAVINGIVVAVDAESIHESLTGTFEGSVALSRQLAKHPRVRTLLWVTSPDRVEGLVGLAAQAGLDSVEVTTLGTLVEAAVVPDVAFRPNQDYSGATWSELAQYCRRNVIWTLDLIATVNPHYADGYENFAKLTAVTRNSWQNADAIGVLTNHVHQTLTSYYLGGDLSKVFILPNGSPELTDLPARPAESRLLATVEGSPYLLVLGTNYLHKNVLWLMRVFLQVKSMGWTGRFVFAGPTPSSGHSTEFERQLVGMTGESESFVFFDRVSHAEKRALIGGATLVLSPSVTEGWGMMPAEAIEFGSVPLASRGGGLRDITPSNAVSLGMANDHVDARTIHNLLVDSLSRDAQRDAWAVSSAELKWADSAEVLVGELMETLLRRRNFKQEPQVYFASVEMVSISDRLRSRVLRYSTVLLPVGSRSRKLVKGLLKPRGFTAVKGS